MKLTHIGIFMIGGILLYQFTDITKQNYLKAESLKESRIAALQSLMEHRNQIGLTLINGEKVIGSEESLSRIPEIEVMHKTETARILAEIDNVRNGIIDSEIQKDIDLGFKAQRMSR